MTDLEKAWAIVDMCYRDPGGDSFRANIAKQIALLLAEIRKARTTLPRSDRFWREWEAERQWKKRYGSL